MSNNYQRTLQESLVLNNIFLASIPKMMKQPDKPLYKIMREFTRKDYSIVANAMCQEFTINMAKELFTLINQLWSADATRFNEGLVQRKAVFNIIKSQILKKTNVSHLTIKNYSKEYEKA